MLLLFRLSLLAGHLGVDQRLLPLVGQLDINNLNVGAIGVHLLQFYIDGVFHFIARLLPGFPKVFVSEVSDGLPNDRINIGNVGGFISLLELTVQLANVFLLQLVLDGKRQSDFLTVTVLDDDWLALGIGKFSEVKIDFG